MIDNIWVEEKMNIFDIRNEDTKVLICWGKDCPEDFKKLSLDYFNTGYKVIEEILKQEHHNNVMYDMWFLPGVYLLRQSLELIAKSCIAKKLIRKPQIQSLFQKYKHNIKGIVDVYIRDYGSDNLNDEELTWLLSYIDTIEEVDSSSDLFRYPFKDEFMSTYENSALDIARMGNKLLWCFSLLHKLGYGEYYNSITLDPTQSPRFITLAKTAMGNCHLWESPFGSNFHKQVTGYGEVSHFVFKLYLNTKESQYVYPLIFLIRNGIEIALKRLLHINTSFSVDEHIVRSKKFSHLLYKDLWKNVRPVVEYYANETDAETGLLDIVEDHILQIKSMDKNGDMFRYPCGYNLEYRFNNRTIDVENVYTFMIGVFNFLDGCDSMLEHINDVESEILSEYRSYMDYY